MAFTCVRVCVCQVGGGEADSEGDPYIFQKVCSGGGGSQIHARFLEHHVQLLLQLVKLLLLLEAGGAIEVEGDVESTHAQRALQHLSSIKRPASAHLRQLLCHQVTRKTVLNPLSNKFQSFI